MKKLLLSAFVFLAIGTVATAQQAPKKVAVKVKTTTPATATANPEPKNLDKQNAKKAQLIKKEKLKAIHSKNASKANLDPKAKKSRATETAADEIQSTPKQ